jgi:MFS family permease
MEQLALGWLVFDLTGSAFMVGVAFAARQAPYFFLGILSGAMTDWLERRLFLRFIGLGASIGAGLMALLLLSDLAQVWSIIAMVALTGGIFMFKQTTTLAYSYDIVGPDHALNGLSLIAMSDQAGHIFGAIIAGALIAALGPGWAWVAISSSYLAAAAVLLAVGKQGRVFQPRREPLLRNVMSYIQIFGQNRVLLVLMCLTSVTEVLGFTHGTLLPVFAREVLSVGPLGLGLINAVRQSGGLFGLALLASLRDYRRKGLLVFIAAAGCGAGLMAFSLSSNLVFFLIVLALTNVAIQSADTLYKTLMQENVPDEQRGRAMGSHVFSLGLAPAGHLGVGGLAGFMGAPGALLVNGAVLLFVNLSAAIGLPKMRRLQ